MLAVVSHHYEGEVEDVVVFCSDQKLFGDARFQEVVVVDEEVAFVCFVYHKAIVSVLVKELQPASHSLTQALRLSNHILWVHTILHLVLWELLQVVCHVISLGSLVDLRHKNGRLIPLGCWGVHFWRYLLLLPLVRRGMSINGLLELLLGLLSRRLLVILILG
jgi:hypothetical protein